MRREPEARIRYETEEQLRQWIQRTAEGDEFAFECLWQHCKLPVWRFLLPMCFDRDVAEELASDVLLAVWFGAAGFSGQSRVSTWIFGIAYHKAIDASRRYRPELTGPEPLLERREPHSGPEHDALAAERASLLYGALQELSPEHRSVLVLVYLNGLSYQEVAEVTKISLGTVKSRVFHAKSKLRASLPKLGATR